MPDLPGLSKTWQYLKLRHPKICKDVLEISNDSEYRPIFHVSGQSGG